MPNRDNVDLEGDVQIDLWTRISKTVSSGTLSSPMLEFSRSKLVKIEDFYLCRKMAVDQCVIGGMESVLQSGTPSAGRSRYTLDTRWRATRMRMCLSDFRRASQSSGNLRSFEFIPVLAYAARDRTERRFRCDAYGSINTRCAENYRAYMHAFSRVLSAPLPPLSLPFRAEGSANVRASKGLWPRKCRR